MKCVLTIAGSDCSGGAGIQADLKTITTHKLYGMSVITALTAQNTTGVYGIMEVTSEFVAKQIDCIFNDIRPHAVKIGMVSNTEIIKIIASKLKEYNATNIVIDPVMVSTSGSKLMNKDAYDALVNDLLPLGTVITPNIPEAEVFTGVKIENKNDMEEAMKILSKIAQGAILIKGGHLENSADDLLWNNSKKIWYHSERKNNTNTHGTGCTLSSAIACNLALNFSLEESIKNAKNYIIELLKSTMNLGQGSGPLEHTIVLK
ncbi:bifunctional hydroxymethylpyrimidine kinase/phosphomethylpyrimidine kinase [Fusobacterium sp. PH5-44]|uniref:bifunctional hydroxymethylpyrimidine kinase/phosphomethylpyrimidine kinase n=1 Tax=unclassified Fusobacterium TaxID=2648384 RepID=UPI003D1D2BDC